MMQLSFSLYRSSLQTESVLQSLLNIFSVLLSGCRGPKGRVKWFLTCLVPALISHARFCAAIPLRPFAPYYLATEQCTYSEKTVMVASGGLLHAAAPKAASVGCLVDKLHAVFESFLLSSIVC